MTNVSLEKQPVDVADAADDPVSFGDAAAAGCDDPAPTIINLLE